MKNESVLDSDKLRIFTNDYVREPEVQTAIFCSVFGRERLY